MEIKLQRNKQKKSTVFSTWHPVSSREWLQHVPGAPRVT